MPLLEPYVQINSIWTLKMFRERLRDEERQLLVEDMNDWLARGTRYITWVEFQTTVYSGMILITKEDNSILLTRPLSLESGSLGIFRTLRERRGETWECLTDDSVPHTDIWRWDLHTDEFCEVYGIFYRMQYNAALNVPATVFSISHTRSTITVEWGQVLASDRELAERR